MGGGFPGALLLAACTAQPEAPECVQVESDDTRIERTCRVELGPGIMRDADGDGVLHVVGDGITVELAGELRGASAEEPADGYAGVGIRVTGKDVTLRGARVAGFRVGIHAEGADGLVLEDCDVSGNFRQRLKSTQAKEAEEDWLTPHANDGHEWFTSYGAGIYVERSSGVTVRRCRARAGQNGLVLDRVERARAYDNDFSFLSGWGIALWRSSKNVVTRNACDFCIRGYSHGVYNRGQDSAGILMFEQCSRNVIAGNSATHCGDGLFAFAGQEALGSVPAPSADFDYTGRGCNENTIVGNDFSFAAAHGLELTFSFGNYICQNRFVGNSICGIWAGYSRGTRIILNAFEENGFAGYGLERGGVNIEHGQGNSIQSNTFHRNACGVHLWWDEDGQLAQLPWVTANGDESGGGVVAWNAFHEDEVAIHLRGKTSARLCQNRFSDGTKELEQAPEAESLTDCSRINWIGNPGCGPIPGTSSPIGARPSLGGREAIQLDDWGPLEPPTASK